MPKLKPDTQRARREHILNSAERCFARSGFHATSMQHICREGAISPGALYLYFSSKEALIEGICERNRLEFQTRFTKLAEAPDFFEALAKLAESYFIHDARDRSLLCMEIGLESTRNARVGNIHQTVDNFVRISFEKLFQKMIDDGLIFPEHDSATLARIVVLLGDGLFWRRGVDPKFQTEPMLKSVIEVIRQLLNPIQYIQKNKRMRSLMETHKS